MKRTRHGQLRFAGGPTGWKQRQAHVARMPHGQLPDQPCPLKKLKASATPGRIVLEIVPTAQGKVIRRGKLKVWTGDVPSTPLAEAVEAARHYER